MTARLILDEHYSDEIATSLRDRGHDVVAAVASADLRGIPDAELFRYAADQDRRIVTENIKDFRPLLLRAAESGAPIASLLVVPPRRFPRGRGRRDAAIVAALGEWLERPGSAERPLEDWLS